MENITEPLNTDRRARIAQLARAGAADEDIAAELLMPLKRLRRRFRIELKRGRAMGRNQIVESFFDNVKSGNSMPITMFWLKSQCGWRDTGPTQDPRPIQSILKVVVDSNGKEGDGTPQPS